MSKGILVTDGADINYSTPLDYVLDSRLKGGLKIAKKIFYNPASDFTFDSVNGYYYSTKTHGLPYVPAVISFQDGKFGVGWQNEALITNSSANADGLNIFMQTASTTPFCLIIFGERVADT